MPSGSARPEREQELMQKVTRGYERFFAECQKLGELPADVGQHEQQCIRLPH
jgi:hypothetical protein